MPAISVGSVEVDILPNATGVRRRMQQQLLPAADSVGDELGRVLGRHVTSHLARAVVQGVTNGGRQAQAPAARQGTQTGSTFARSLKSRLEAAMASMPEIRLRADSSDAERELYQIRAQMQALRDVRIGIDVSEADAVAAMDRLRERLARLSASSANVAVRVDAGAAAAQLAAFQAEINRLDGQSVDVDVDTHAATANIGGLVTAALALGPAIIPALPVIAAGLGAVAAAATAAAAGVGGIALVAAPAFKQMATVMQAQKAAQDAATNASLRGGQAASQAASRSLQQASAAQALAAAERNGARQVAQAQAQVKQARQAAADAAAQAAQRNADAARRVQEAERSLADAQTAAKRAQLDLTAARKQASQELEDLNNRLTDAQLSQRDAEIQLQEAAAQRDAVLKNANATELDKQKALLAYDQAVQRLKEQTTETQRLQEETKAANKAGVEGTDTYKSAQDRLAQAQRNVVDQQQAVKDAQAEAARTQLETTRQVAEAQQRVSEATANVAVAQQNAADAVASAQRQVESASLSAASGVDQAAIAQAKYDEELAKLTPAARDTFDAFLDLKSAFGDWSKSLQPAVMPIFTRALVGLRDTLPTLTPFVTGAADAIKELQDRASDNLKKPFWQGFKKDLQGSVKPAIIGLGVAFGNVLTGMAGVIDAFLPHMDGISGRLQSITGRFAEWGKGLKGSPEFEQFLSYSSEHAPIVADTFGKIAGALLSVGSALAPVSGPLLEVIGGTAQAIGWLATNVPGLVPVLYGLFIATRLWALWQLILNGAMTAFQVISSMGPWGWIALAIVGVVLAVMALWKHCEGFRDAVKAVWSGIQSGAQAVIDWFTGTFVPFFTTTIPNAAQAVIDWVRENWPWILVALTGPIGLAVVAIVKHWDDIEQGFSDAWTSIKKYTLYPVRDFFTKTVPGWANSLADKVVGAFDAARKGIKTAWDKIKNIAREPVQYVVDVVYNNGIRGVWNKIAGAFGAPKLSKFTFASGGIMPGYTPGRDVHRFVSPTGGALELSGGEAIMRPEFTRAVGSNFVHAMNTIARSRGAQGVKAALAPVFGGNPATPTDTSLRYADGGVVQRFADGGIFGWIKSAGSKVLGAGSKAWNAIKKGASWLTDTLEASARAGVKHVVDPLLKQFPGMDTGIGKMIRRIPTRIIDALFGYSKEADKRGAGGIGGPRIQAALKWARTQAGKPYQWAGNGNPSWDCSGFMSAIESVIRGQKPHRRWATMAFHGKTAPPGWVYHGNSPFRIGITNAGVGHTAGTLGKTNVESRGGDGVVVGRRARGYDDRLFTSWYGFQPGKYDSGGWMPPGMNLMYNGLGQPEAVLTPTQWSAIQGAAARGADGPQQPVVVELHAKEGALGQFIDVRVQEHDKALIQVLNAS
ncbi:hypothetical protein [Streptomyces reticuli]|uniref:hypothetical protein n=1 Tax=Streptomyces reticuli TaxID=1926 RepID=UPI00073DBB4B|nr:hypothetical protein [Streptomyces sp. SID7810]CUW31792.1 hypothetical protein TUE45_06541 [Streptomyces reticuli]